MNVSFSLALSTSTWTYTVTPWRKKLAGVLFWSSYAAGSNRRKFRDKLVPVSLQYAVCASGKM